MIAEYVHGNPECVIFNVRTLFLIKSHLLSTSSVTPVNLILSYPGERDSDVEKVRLAGLGAVMSLVAYGSDSDGEDSDEDNGTAVLFFFSFFVSLFTSPFFPLFPSSFG